MLASLFWGMILSAQAEEVFSLEMVKQALEDEKYDQALDAWKTERKKLSCPTRIPATRDLAQFWVYKGYVHYVKGTTESDQEEYSANQEAWKRAFIIDPEIQFDESILEGISEDDKENTLNFFEQNRRLVASGKRVDTQVPEKIREAQLFVDGNNVVQDSTVLAGPHLFQINCPQDSLQSKWMFLDTEEDQINWLELCPSGVDTTVEVESNDMFAEMGFGSGIDTSNIHNPEPVCHKDPTISGKSKSFSMPKIAFTKEKMVLAGGGVLLSSGIASYYLWTMPKFSSVEAARADIGSLTETEAAQISKEFNIARWTTLGLLTTGIGVTSYGTVLQLQTTGTGILISGKF